MKICEGVYKLSGWEYGTNSNVYGITAGDELLLIDAGFSTVQYRVVERNRRSDPEITGLAVRNVFLTHAHGDHAGLAYLYQEQGAKIHISAQDAQAIEQVTPVMLGDLFNEAFHSCRADEVIEGPSTYRFADGVSIQAIPAPGHTAGTLIYLAQVRGKRVAFLGDIIVIGAVSPAEEMTIEIGWKGSPDYDEDANRKTLAMLRELKCDIAAMGHAAVYFGSLDELLQKARISEN